MVDFKYLNSPEGKKKREEMRKEREREDQRQEAKDKANRFMLDKLFAMFDEIDNEWEREFLNSIDRRMNMGNSLTEKQEEILTKIFEKW